MSIEFSEWLQRQEILCFEAQKLANGAGLRATTIVTGKEPPILRIAMDGTWLDFRIKEIKTSEVKNIWIGKISEIVPEVNWLVHSKKEGFWIYILSEIIFKKGRRRESDYSHGIEYYVVDRMLFKDYKRLLKSLKNKEKLSQQKVLSSWF